MMPSLLNSLFASILPDYLHSSEYPNDDYSHILGIDDPKHTASKLQQISAHRIKEVITNKIPLDTDGCGIDRTFYISSDDLFEDIVDFDDKYGPPLNLYEKLIESYEQSEYQMAIATEFKRASPSKGNINMDIDVVEQCLQYAEMGAAVVSVLTELNHFKGIEEHLFR